MKIKRKKQSMNQKIVSVKNLSISLPRILSYFKIKTVNLVSVLKPILWFSGGSSSAKTQVDEKPNVNVQSDNSTTVDGEKKSSDVAKKEEKGKEIELGKDKDKDQGTKRKAEVLSKESGKIGVTITTSSPTSAPSPPPVKQPKLQCSETPISEPSAAFSSSVSLPI